jgi:hypothetical protein
LSRTAAAILVGFAAAQMGCAAGGRPLRLQRVTTTESGGHFQFATTSPIRSVACAVRDHRRSPSDPAAARIIWAGRCDSSCPTSIRYGDSQMTAVTKPERLVPSAQGGCYECVLDGDGTRGVVSFRVNATGGFEPCSARVGNL